MSLASAEGFREKLSFEKVDWVRGSLQRLIAKRKKGV